MCRVYIDVNIFEPKLTGLYSKAQWRLRQFCCFRYARISPVAHL